MPDTAPRGKLVKLAGDGWAMDAHYHELGSGQNYVLFLQTGGAGTSAYMSWYLNLEPFAAAGYHVLAPDAPNFGLSAVPEGMTVPAPAFAVAFMEALGVRSAHLVGNSIHRPDAGDREDSRADDAYELRPRDAQQARAEPVRHEQGHG
ncbi:MAG: 2-hydroxy-6-oxo-6-phenylhexa-2,4-dienoate hydrolase [Chloroflexi bacterium]|nr:2-hydroxy-6-oxo-6-phenylhexa-2,4-dienoate hydrolase [Chloroflexota bacterium]